MSDLISRQAAIDALNVNIMFGRCNGKTVTFEMMKKYAEFVRGKIDALPSAQPPVLTCDGCRHVGTYDTDFPCSVCIRREKDYYEQER